MRPLRMIITGVAAATASVVLAQPALAAGFQRDVGDGIVRYADPTDELCVRADDTTGTAWVEVTLTRPGVVGKPVVIRDDNVRHPGATCAVLTAFEDTTFRAAYESYWSGRGTVLRGAFQFGS
ncbi:hypothetical protein HD597_004076 [Nonomuraea thailandensis]|uniref:SH3 domain-containing protein n=1 Tax=Nonomuraea thailandensis TaxID=1188745 RepID=A0A9X2K4Y4_9ACTN|nr:hypothetical protein [Nonomuraea thailandensis]MCP2357056.1 hypothetical protein [Nonomuraea thailandensis]